MLLSVYQLRREEELDFANVKQQHAGSLTKLYTRQKRSIYFTLCSFTSLHTQRKEA